MKKLALILPLLLLCGCWDYNEPNMQNYVLGMSIDYYDNLYHVCIETVKITGEPTALSASEGVLIESSGITIFDAVRDAIMTAGKKLYWGHAELIIMSEDVARDHLSAVCDVLSRSQDIYSNISLAVAEAPNLARDILKAKTPSDTLMSQHIANIFKNEEPSRRFVRTELWQLERDFPYTPLPLLKTENDTPIAEGAAMIHDMTLVGKLTGSEVQIFSLISEPSSGGYLPAIKLADSTVTLEILRSSTSRLKDGSRLDIMVALSGIDGDGKFSCSEVAERAREVIIGQIDGILQKPYGNPLPDESYDVHVELNSTGLIRN